MPFVMISAEPYKDMLSMSVWTAWSRHTSGGQEIILQFTLFPEVLSWVIKSCVVKNGHAAFVLRQQVCFAKINWENLFYEAIYFLEIYARCKKRREAIWRV